MIYVGDIVRNKENGNYGTVHYSSFGISIHTWDEERKALGKTLGYPAKDYEPYWETVELPAGYELAPYGGLIKIK